MTQVFQYFKDGVVHIDYAVPHFFPLWVNQIRKGGLFFLGNPRRIPYEGGRRFYHLSRADAVEAGRWWQAYGLEAVETRLADHRNIMRQTGLRAGEYYEHSHAEEKPVGRLLSLAIALEALFSPDDKGEFNFRIAQYVSQLVGTTPAVRVELFQETKRFYTRRSKLVHGQYDMGEYAEGRFVTHAECDRWASVIRQAVLRFLTLYLRGCNDRAEVLRRLERAALDPLEADQVREVSDIARLLDELVPPRAARP